MSSSSLTTGATAGAGGVGFVGGGGVSVGGGAMELALVPPAGTSPRARPPHVGYAPLRYYYLTGCLTD